MEAGSWWTDYSLMRKRGLEAQEGTLCQVVCASMIMMNAIVIGLETDFPEWTGWSFVENSFLVFFTCELTARLVLYTPRKYFSYSAENPDLVWNVFDFLIVTFGLVDMLSTFVAPDCSSMKFATIFRMIRLLRILRIIRIIRFLKQLYLLAYGFVEAALAIVWVTVLMTFVLYICSIVIVRLYGHTKRSGADADFLRENFGTVPECMLTLFKLMSNPDLGPYHSVIDGNPSLLPFFVGFIIFGSFGMIALLTGVISESMFEKNKARIEEERLERETKRARFQRECQLLFDTMDQDQTGSVSHTEIMQHKEEVVALLEDAGIKIGELELQSLCLALDFDADGGVDRVEFENGVIQMCEEIRPMSIMELHHSIRKCQMLVESHMSQLMCKMESVDGMVNDINKHLGLSPATGETPAEGYGSVPLSGRCNELIRKRSTASARPSPRCSSRPCSRVQRLEVPRPQQWSGTVAGKDSVEFTKTTSCQSSTDAVKLESLAGARESKGPSTAKDSLLQGFQHHLQELSVLGAELQRVALESTQSWQPPEVGQNNVHEIGSLSGLRAEAEKRHDPDPVQVPDFLQAELALTSSSSHEYSAKRDSLGDDFLDGSCAAAVNTVVDNESAGSSANANVDATTVGNEPGGTGLLDGSIANVDATVEDESGGAVVPGSASASTRQSPQSTVHSSDVECDKGMASSPGS